MNLLGILTVLLLPLSVHAADCRGTICVGSWVIDSSDNVGQVTGFPDQDTVRYKINGYGYDASLANLIVEVAEYKGLKAQKLAIDSSDNVGTVSKVFSDGRALYKINGYSYVSKNLSVEVSEINHIQKNMGVLDSSDNYGNAIAVFENGKIQYTINGYQYVSSNLVGEVSQIKGISANTIVIDSSDNVGKALNAFRDGRVRYQIGGYPYVSSSLVPETSAIGLISKGKTVIDSSDNIGTAMAVFADGRVQYKIGGYPYVSKSLKAQVASYNGIQAGNIVIDSSDNIGSALVIFEDGRIQYKIGGYPYVSKSLVPAISELNGFKPKLLVIDSNDNVGILQIVFRDGRMSYSIGSYSYVSKSLSQEVPSHPTYKKDTIYSSSDYEIGNPIHFFANQKVQLELLNGAGYAVSTTLYKSIDHIDEYTSGSEIVDSDAKEAIISSIFENGSITYTLVNQTQADDTLHTGKISGFFLEKDPKKLVELNKNEINLWLIYTANLVAKTNKMQSWWSSYKYYTLITTKEKIPGIKKDALEALFEDPGLIQSKELRLKVRDYLSQ